MRNGVEVARLAGEIGARVYIGPAFRSYKYAYDEQGTIQWDPDVAPGWHWSGASVDEIAPMSYPVRSTQTGDSGAG